VVRARERFEIQPGKLGSNPKIVARRELKGAQEEVKGAQD
jgi:hypothetical protein